MRGAATTSTSTTGARGDVRLAVAGLVVLWAAALAGQVWVFALLFLGWAAYDVWAGESHFIQRVTRAEHPVVFWSIVASWVAMSILWIVYPT
ncbi:MAG TPA: hypothetical protein DDY35_11365 [Acidimicrobiaceae bacterium]|nr:hypothetical protein [Acidimicrobiaceae bacterium]HBH77048.1 hypothetical protein [Acidimicrobiaceae bacterium]|tara:strand:- start:191 stop:466 length:276 start_codon:yes stop_codon:yes gene_type:complete